MNDQNTSGLSPEMLRIFDTLPANILVLSRELVILNASDAYLNLTNRTREEITWKHLFDVYPERPSWTDRDGGMTESLQEVLRTGKPHHISITRIDIPDPAKPGALRPRWWRTSNTPVMTGEKIDYIIHQTEDVSNQMLNEQQLMDLNEELALTNEELQAATEEALAANEALNNINDALESTVEKRTRELAETSLLLNRVIATTPVGLTIFRGRDFVIEMANQPVLDIWGRSRGQAVGRKLMDVFPELIGQPFPDMLHKVLDTGETVALSEIPVDVNQPGGDIQKFYVDFSYDALFDLEGKPDAVLVSVKDITPLAESRHLLQERQEELEAMNEELEASNEEIRATNDELYDTNKQLAETQERVALMNIGLRESESRFRNMVRSATVGIVLLIGKDMRIDIVNDAYAKLIGRTAEELRGKLLFDIVPESEAFFRSVIDPVRETGEPLFLYDQPYFAITDGVKYDGYLDLVYQPYREPDGSISGVMVLCQDMTENVRMRQELESNLAERTKLSEDLQDSRQRLQTILDTMAEGVVIMDTEENVLYANAMALRILGKSIDDLKNRDYNDEKWTNTTIDGAPLPKSEHPIHMAMSTGTIVIDQEIGVKPQNGEPFFISYNATPLFDENGKVTGGIATMMDVTNRRKLMQQKDEFISIASHELKTPVTSLKAVIQLMDRMKTTMNNETRDKLMTQANRSLDKLSKLINDLLNFNRISRGQLSLHKTRFNMANLVNDCCQHIVTAGAHQIIVKGDLELELTADEQQIDQVLVNLINNAVKYAPNSKEITINIERKGEEALISVIDNGPGIPTEKVPHLFERYYRADYNGMQFSGLGLGLYISASIIEKHGGRIGVKTELGKGSTFWFTLPL